MLSLLEESDRNIRYYSTKLLTYLLANRGAEIEAAVLQSPAHITRLMDLLKLGNEMIRNEALLLLIEISKTNIELQKVIAFENGFENLLDIIESEGYSNGGIVVQDCLTLINNLLTGNTSNQNHFREMNCIKRLSELLKVETSDFWTLSDDKRDNLVLTLNTVCLLLGSPSSVPVSPQILALACAPPTPLPSQSSSSGLHGSRTGATSPSPSASNWVSLLCPVPSIQSTQSQLGTHRIHARTIEIGISQLRAPTVRIKALWALGDEIFCHNDNRVFLEQHDFATRGTGRTSALLKVTQIVFLSKVPMESLAALHVLKCYFHNNQASQRVFAATIVRPADPSPQSLAQLAEEAYPARIIVGYLAALSDPMKTFFASLCLCYILTGNTGVKEQLLKVSFDAQTTPGTHFDNLLAKLVKWLVQAVDGNSELPIIVGLFRAIAAWVEDCPMAGNYFRTIQVISPSAGGAPVSIMTYLASLIPQNASAATNPNMNFAAGLAAHVYGLAVDPTLPSTHESFERSQMFQARLDSLRLSPDFVRIERGGPRALDEESKLPFFDAPFALSLLRLSNTLFPPIPGAHHAPSPTPIVTAMAPPPSTVHRPAPTAPHTEPHSTHAHPSNPSTPNGPSAPNGQSPESVHPAPNGHPHPNHAHAHAHPHAHPHSSHNHTPSPTSHAQPQANGGAEVESLRAALAALSEWQRERTSLQTQLQQAQNYSAQLQAQLSSTTASNQSLITQLTQLQVSSAPKETPTSPQLKADYDQLKLEYDNLMTEHEDLLVLLAETQDENEALQKASAPTSPQAAPVMTTYSIAPTQGGLFDGDAELL